MDDDYLNGYAKHCGINATGVYMSLCRHVDSKTQVCFPSKGTIAKKLAISERSVYNAIKMLEKYNLIKIQEQKRKADGSFQNNVYTLLDKLDWITPQANGAVGRKQHDPQANDDIHRRHQVPNKDTHKNKDTHIKGLAIKDRDPINEIIKLFEPINPSYKQLFANKTERAAIERMIKNMGEKKLVATINALPDILSKKYAPRISRPTQLENKLGELIMFYKQESESVLIINED